MSGLTAGLANGLDVEADEKGSGMRGLLGAMTAMSVYSVRLQETEQSTLFETSSVNTGSFQNHTYSKKRILVHGATANT